MKWTPETRRQALSRTLRDVIAPDLDVLIGAYRIAFGRPRATFGRQPDELAGALVWVLPNTSGLNAHYQAAGFVEAFAELRRAIDLLPRPDRVGRPSRA